MNILEKAALERSIEELCLLQDGISKEGQCELKGCAYDYASLRILEALHWLELLKEQFESAP